MRLSTLIYFPLNAATNCLQAAYRNKGTLAKATAGVVAGVSAVALAGLLANNQHCMNEMQNDFMDAVKQFKDPAMPFRGHAMLRGVGYDECHPFYEPFKVNFTVDKDSPDMQFINETVMNLYNNATSSGRNFFNDYEYSYNIKLIKDSNTTLNASFLICRSSLLSQLESYFSAP